MPDLATTLYKLTILITKNFIYEAFNTWLKSLWDSGGIKEWSLASQQKSGTFVLLFKLISTFNDSLLCDCCHFAGGSMREKLASCSLIFPGTILEL